MSHFKQLIKGQIKGLCPLIFASLLLSLSPTSFAQNKGSSGSGGGGSFSFNKRADAREAKRWTLEDWLAQRDRSQLMDLWLSLNSPSPYELMLGVAHRSYKTEISAPSSAESFTSLSAEFSAYAQIFGLSAEYENNAAEKFNDLSGMFNLRIFGNSIQSSALILHYGLRTRTMAAAGLTPETRVGQQFAQVSLQLYLRKYFGIDGHYRLYMPTSETTLGDLKSNEVEAGAFIDFKSLRVFGSYYQEKNQSTAPAASSPVDTDRTGIKAGIKLFF